MALERELLAADYGGEAFGEALFVTRRQGYGLVDGFQYVRFDQTALPKDANRCTVSIKQCTVFGQLFQLHFRHAHERIDLMFRTLEVLYTKGVDCNDLDAGFVAHFENLLRASVQMTPSKEMVLPAPKTRNPDYALLRSRCGGSAQSVCSHPSQMRHAEELALV